MNRLIALLRGINVGGKNRVLMADLKQLFIDLGYFDVVTYIQSGNVIFSTESEISINEITSMIEKSIYEKYGFLITAVVLTEDELDRVIRNNPYNRDDSVDIKKLHATFLQSDYTMSDLASLNKYDFTPDLYTVKDRTIYLYCTDKYHTSKLSNTLFERKLDVSATTRTWRTVIKLKELVMK